MVAELVRRFALALAFCQLALAAHAAAATITSPIMVSPVLQFRSPMALPVNAVIAVVAAFRFFLSRPER